MSYKTKQRIFFIVRACFGLFLIVITGSLLPFDNNYKLMAIMSGSMEPSLKTGSLALITPTDHYKTGDIITFKDPDQPKSTTTHRIVEIHTENSKKIIYYQGGCK